MQSDQGQVSFVRLQKKEGRKDHVTLGIFLVEERFRKRSFDDLYFNRLSLKNKNKNNKLLWEKGYYVQKSLHFLIQRTKKKPDILNKTQIMSSLKVSNPKSNLSKNQGVQLQISISTK